MSEDNDQTGLFPQNFTAKVQDVRVDNWGNYCLQRLQVMYDRGDFCDLILQFHNDQILKVHRVVVNLCTEYFANLERLFGLTNGMLVLSKEVEYNAMLTIVKFFYTGKLEVRGNQFNDIYKTVKLMNITILTKLLEAHARKPILQAKKEPSRPIVFKQAVEIGRPLQKIQIQQNALQGATLSMSPQGSINLGGKNVAVGRSLPPGSKTKTVLARVQPQNSKYPTQGTMKSTMQKKLPIWKERKFSPIANSDSHMMEKWPPKEESPKPTRFEWPDPDEDSFVNPATHSLMERQKAARKPEDIFDTVKIQHGVKRSSSLITIDRKSEGPPAKILKVEEVEVINLNDDSIVEEIVESEADTQRLEDLSSDEQDLTQMTIEIDSESREVESEKIEILESKISHPGPSNLASSNPGPKVEKTVRFADLIKENPVPSSTVNNSGSNSPKKSPMKYDNIKTVVVPTEGGSDSLANHSKIISEVLKKYPDLVKENKNIKLKIVQKGSDNPKESKAKVSYIVLKSTSAPDGPGSVVLKKSSPTASSPASKSFWDSDKDAKKSPSGAENTIGPWICTTCGEPEDTIEFDSYFLYRRHLVEVHNERIDARICEYCGQKASKRNLLLYHLYTKHGVAPPQNCVFPHCDRCDYVALSESLLAKHKSSHDLNKEFACSICNASFKSNGALQGHMAANLHRNKETKVYECPYCRKPFVRNINLKAHIRSLHRDVARVEEMEDPRLPPDETISRPILPHGKKARQFPSIIGRGDQGILLGSGEIEEDGTGDPRMEQVSLLSHDGSTIEIIHGLDPNSLTVPVSLVPSSEAEALNNVATSIAASLGLDTQSGIQTGAEYVTGGEGGQAVYIVDGSQVDVGAMEAGMILTGGEGAHDGSFIVQDIHGNQFRKMTGIDENGKEVIFFQLSDDAASIVDHAMSGAVSVGVAPGHYDFVTEQHSEEAGQVVQTATFSVQNDHMYLDPQKCSVFVSSSMGGIPVTVPSSVEGEQVLLTDGESQEETQIIEMVPVSTIDQEEELTGHEELQSSEILEETECQAEQPVRELHLVLEQDQEQDQEEGQLKELEQMETTTEQTQIDSGEILQFSDQSQTEHEEAIEEDEEEVENVEMIDGVDPVENEMEESSNGMDIVLEQTDGEDSKEVPMEDLPQESAAT